MIILKLEILMNYRWICITNVHTLISLTTSLNVAMIITLRKFLSMVLSVILFKNPFTIMHCVGCFLVLLGSIAFTSCDFKFKLAQKKNV